MGVIDKRLGILQRSGKEGKGALSMEGTSIGRKEQHDEEEEKKLLDITDLLRV
jgi:hypothetical protein